MIVLDVLNILNIFIIFCQPIFSLHTAKTTANTNEHHHHEMSVIIEGFQITGQRICLINVFHELASENR